MKPSHILMLLVGGLTAMLLAVNLWVRHVLPEFQQPPPRPPPPMALRMLGRAFNPVPQSAPAKAPRTKDASKQRSTGTNLFKVTHEPLQPKSGQPVLITAQAKALPDSVKEVLLEYQVVDPGTYIALRDGAFEKQWDSVPLTAGAATAGDASGGRVFTAELPGSLQKHRRLVRYRIRSAQERKILAPDESDTQPNFAYFVYDNVPAWKGAIDPNGRDSRVREPVTYSREALQRVPVYQFISSKQAVENVTWLEPDQFGERERHEYKYTGTMVYDGVVYDHVGFRARGGSWRHAMGKNMWKFNFLPGHRFAARDDYGNRYRTKWDKLNLGACIQQGDYGMRGEQGMFEAVGFRLFNLAGIEAPETHWVHLRIIDQPEENPADQYAGDFWGLYLAVENEDHYFLKEHDLPAGNLYKIEFRAKTTFNGNPAITNQADVNEFLRATMRGQQPDSWWQENVDLSRYYAYRSIIECIHHYDVDAGKNYFYYLNPETRKWVVLPWDIDLTWGDRMYGGGQEPFYRAGLLFRPPFKPQYQERLAEIRDLLFNPEQAGQLIDEHAAMISDPKGGPSLADADRAKWDYNPVMVAPFVLQMKAGQGRFYFGSTRNTFQTMVKYMKSYVAKRTAWIDARLLADYRPPTAPKIATGPLNFAGPGLNLRLESKTENPGGTIRWRLAEITDPKSPTFNPRQPWKYEIQALWDKELNDSTSVSVPTTLLTAGHTYRVRARWQDPSGTWSRWSAPLQFTIPP
jgi:CotH kinase protein